jgi:CheY-like chemotaxis protein
MQSLGTVLIIEDDVLLSRLISTILTRANYQVMSVTDGAKALDALQIYTPDLILLDMYLPRLNGWEFVQKYREMSVAQAPIVAISVGQVDLKLVTGINAFVQKPFFQTNLLQVIQKSMNERGSTSIMAN